MNKPIPYERARRLMIEEQLRRRGIRDERVLEAMMNVPRHAFVPCSHLDAAYADRPLPIGTVETISQPYIVAAMTEAARVMPGDRALEVGTGSGYQAAILASLGAQVYTIERNPQLVAAARDRLVLLGYEGIEVIWGDGTEGYAPASPYQVIMVTAAAPEVPPPLFEQLANGGRLVIPLGDMARQDLYLMIKEGDWMTKHVLDPCMFVPLIGKYGWPERPGWIN